MQSKKFDYIVKFIFQGCVFFGAARPGVFPMALAFSPYIWYNHDRGNDYEIFDRGGDVVRSAVQGRV